MDGREAGLAGQRGCPLDYHFLGAGLQQFMQEGEAQESGQEAVHAKSTAPSPSQMLARHLQGACCRVSTGMLGGTCT